MIQIFFVELTGYAVHDTSGRFSIVASSIIVVDPLLLLKLESLFMLSPQFVPLPSLPAKFNLFILVHFPLELDTKSSSS